VLMYHFYPWVVHVLGVAMLMAMGIELLFLRSCLFGVGAFAVALCGCGYTPFIC
jgi:hypothetical protein